MDTEQYFRTIYTALNTYKSIPDFKCVAELMIPLIAELETSVSKEFHNKVKKWAEEGTVIRMDDHTDGYTYSFHAEKTKTPK